MAATYEQAYDTLKKFGWGDDEIKSELARKGLTPTGGGGNGGGGNGGGGGGIPANDDVINGADLPDNYIPIDNDYTDKEGNEKFGELTGEFTEKHDDDEANGPELLTPANGVRGAVIMEEILRQGVAKPILNWVSKQGGAKAALKVLGTKIPKLGTWLAEHAPTANQAMAIINGLISGYQNYVDRGNGILKAEYGVNGNYSSEAYWNDFLRNMVAYGDEYFAKLPSQLLKMAGKEGLNDYLYNTNSEDIKNQKEDLDKNEEVKDTYSKLGGGGFSNFLGVDRFEDGYLEEEKNIKKKYGAEGVMKAEQQLTSAAADMSAKGNPVFNDADFKKFIIDEGYKFKPVQNKDGSRTKTWARDSGLKDKNGKPILIRLEDDTKEMRAKYGKSNEVKDKDKKK